MIYFTYYSMICKFDVYMFHHMNNKNIKKYLVNPRFQGNVAEWTMMAYLTWICFMW